MTIMKNGFEGIKKWAISRIPKAKLRWGFMAALVAILLLRSYFVRVLLTSELFFAFAFAGVLLIAGAAYVMGAVGASWLVRSRQNVERD